MTKHSLGIIAAEFNLPLVDTMVASAQEELARNGAIAGPVVRVPGCYELPLIADRMLKMANLGGIVVLGYIERGETQHGEVMGHVVHAALIDLELRHGKPIGIGIIGPGATPAQAELRKVDYATAAVRAALASLRKLEEI